MAALLHGDQLESQKSRHSQDSILHHTGFSGRSSVSPSSAPKAAVGNGMGILVRFGGMGSQAVPKRCCRERDGHSAFEILLTVQFPIFQDLVELYLTNCEKLTAKSLQTLVSFSHTLISLSLFGCCNIFYEEENPGGCEDDCLVNPTRQVLVKDFTFEGFSRLRFLNLGRLIEGVNVETLLRPLTSLAALDLSGIQLNDVGFLTQWKDSLVSLVLYNMDLSEEHIQVIAQLHKLRSADLFFLIYLFPTDRNHASLLGMGYVPFHGKPSTAGFSL